MTRLQPDGPDLADEEEPWKPPRKSLLRKVGLTVLLIALGVAPGLALMATDPLGTNEVPPEAPRPGDAPTTTPPIPDEPSPEPPASVEPTPTSEPPVPEEPPQVEREPRPDVQDFWTQPEPAEDNVAEPVEPAEPPAEAPMPEEPPAPASAEPRCLLILCVG